MKYEIEALICRGHLSRYVAKKVDQPKPIEEKATEQPQDNQPMVRVISTIYGEKASMRNRESEP